MQSSKHSCDQSDVANKADIMKGRVQGVPLDDEQEVEEEEVDQQPPNRPSSHSEALQHVHSLMQFSQTICLTYSPH